MDNQRLIGSRIKQFRKKKGLSQTDLGSIINTSAMQVSYIENGERHATDEVLGKMASALGVNVGDFLVPIVTTKMSTITYGRMTSDISVEQKSDVENSLSAFDDYVRRNVI